MGEVDLVFGFCVYYTKNPEQRRAQQLVLDKKKMKRWKNLFSLPPSLKENMSRQLNTKK
jgi:hypothetical protein